MDKATICVTLQNGEQFIVETAEYRKESGMTQEEVAKSMEVPQSTIARLEGYKTIPRIDTYIKYLDAVGYKLKIVPKDDTDE